MDAAFLKNYRILARYNRWMNQRLYQACVTLPEGADYTSDLHPDWLDRG